MAVTCDEASRPACGRSPGLRLALAQEIECHGSAELVDPARPPHQPPRLHGCRWRAWQLPRLELNRPEGSSIVAPLANVTLTTCLYVSPVHTMPPWDQTGMPGFVGFTHFHSSTISGVCRVTSRTFASVFPRQSPSFLIFSSNNAEADSTATGLFMHTSNSHA